jgi:hypothetical protein
MVSIYLALLLPEVGYLVEVVLVRVAGQPLAEVLLESSRGALTITNEGGHCQDVTGRGSVPMRPITMKK